MIELFHVWKQYQKPYWALSDVTLQIRAGEFYFITGPSGSGKTTLLRTIFREILPTEGQILIDGVNALKIPDSKIWKLRRQMGIVFQDFRLMFHRTVFDNVAVPLQVIGVNRKEIRRRVFATLQKVSLHQKMWELPSRLSYGEQQRVAIARAVVNNPEIILADEPTGNLDPELAFEIVSLFKEINRQGTTVIIGSHDRELIRHFGDNILFLQKGKIVGKEGR
ncbi:MAG TPA: cell division ATP-binding protein FtsE [Terriglobales bacterium]|nr:cell division ATP-binding protein FtsE [Terriglobales bacterium]